MSEIAQFLERHGLPTRLGDLIGCTFIYRFDDGDEWAGTITGIHVGRHFKGFMIDTSGWHTELGSNFAIEEIDVLVSQSHRAGEKVHTLHRQMEKRLQLSSFEAMEYYKGEFMLSA